MSTTRRCIYAAIVGAFGAAVYLRLVEPWVRCWGTTRPERSWHLPIDDLVVAGGTVTTRAVTVHTPIEHVWPWLVQIGQDRAGFYSYTKLENLVVAGMCNADAVNPAWQQRAVGESVWLADPRRWHDRGRQIAALVDPPRSLVLVSPADWARLGGGRARVGCVGLLSPCRDRATDPASGAYHRWCGGHALVRSPALRDGAEDDARLEGSGRSRRGASYVDTLTVRVGASITPTSTSVRLAANVDSSSSSDSRTRPSGRARPEPPS